MIRPIAVLLVLAACGKDGDKAEPKTVEPGSAVKPTTPEPTPVPVQPSKMTVTRGGKPIAMTKAFIKRVSPDHWRVMLSDKEGSCPELLSGVTTQQAGATSIVVTLRRHLRPDGTDEISVMDLWATGRTTPAPGSGAASLSIPPDKDAKVEIELSKVAVGDLSVEGTMTALGCGDQPAMDAGIPKDKHVSSATITVANHKLDIKNAIARGEDLTLSSGPLDCSGVTPFSQLVVRRQLGRWYLGGTWLPEEVSSDVKELTATLGAQGGSKDGPTIAVTVGGAATIGGYALALEGTVEALDCQKPR